MNFRTIIEIKLYPEASGRVAPVNLRWEDPDTRQVIELSKDFDSSELAYEFQDAAPYFQRSVIVAEFAEILKKSYWAEDSSMHSVYREAQRLSEYLPWDEDMGEFMELIRRATGLTD